MSTPNPPISISTPEDLPPEALSLATRLFDAARQGTDEDLLLLRQALGEGGLRPNMRNARGDTLVSIYLLLYFGGFGYRFGARLERIGEDQGGEEERGKGKGVKEREIPNCHGW